MKIRQLTGVIALLIGIGSQCSLQAGQFFFPVGISYASGISDATDKLYDFYKQDGWDVDRIDVPIGLTLNPFYEWDSGIGVGLTVGPTAFIVVDEKTIGEGSSTDNVKFSYAVPVGGFVRYTLWRDRTVSPYVRAGVKYPLAGGDNLESSDVGPFGAVGVETLAQQEDRHERRGGIRRVQSQSQIHDAGRRQSVKEGDLRWFHRRFVCGVLILSSSASPGA